MSRFKVGDKVTWTSQASGFAKEKTGTIVMIVPENTYFLKIEKELQNLGKKFSSKYGGGFSRDHESYAVFVPTPSGKSNHLYWPVVDKLMKI